MPDKVNLRLFFISGFLSPHYNDIHSYLNILFVTLFLSLSGSLDNDIGVSF